MPHPSTRGPGSRANSGHALLTQAEVGELLGVSKKAVRDVEHRALRKLGAAITREANAAGLSVYEWLYGEE